MSHQAGKRGDAATAATQRALLKLLRDGIERGERAAEKQHTFTHEQARERLCRWLGPFPDNAKHNEK